MDRTVKNIAHRGASALMPENTLPAFQLAMELGADEVELDVVRCATGEAVVIHNETVDKTTEGTGAVADKSLAELKELDAGSWFDQRFRGTTIPTLDEVFESLGATLAVNIELKGESLSPDGLELAVIESVRRHGMTDRVIISSFNPCRLWRARSQAPELKTALIFSPYNSIYLRKAWFAPILKVDGLHTFHSMVDERFVNRAHRRGRWVYAWTVDEPEMMIRLVRNGVDGVVTNDPGLLKEVMEGKYGDTTTEEEE
ncbi:MAG: glycerophosphodiester phosphodiesterase [Candidatus Hydrogenedentes bacterium]|nr:glycerophosphodiester phosphodiesterase [Candidatus Hydrogenedentota bacterium]